LDEIVDSNSYYPIEIRMHSGEIKVCATPEDVPSGEAFRVLRTKVETSIIINTGIAHVWPSSIVSAP
jgi:hypothetical protein